ncbi:hypothetical protein [Acidisarcina polymorpha]|nr:hypothetical protein [Acidisarcina polymorpha]
MAQTATPDIATFLSETGIVNGVRLHYWLGGNPHSRPVMLWDGFLSTG